MVFRFRWIHRAQGSFIRRARGDGMVSDHIQDGSDIGEAATPADIGDVVVSMVDGKNWVKSLHQAQEGYKLFCPYLSWSTY
jgi:SOS-response transcriptional repressor LexA